MIITLIEDFKASRKNQQNKKKFKKLKIRKIKGIALLNHYNTGKIQNF